MITHTAIVNLTIKKKTHKIFQNPNLNFLKAKVR